MNPAEKRFLKKYGAVADAVSRLDVPQTTREEIAAKLTEAFESVGDHDFKPSTFRLIASDPLCACVGYTHRETGELVPCPEAREIRIGMHLSSAPDGRSAAWRPEKPTAIRCVECGAMEFAPGFQESRLRN